MPPWLPQAIDDSWAYVLDDTGVYGPGWWPFYANQSWPQAGRSAEASPRPCGVRLAPDVAFYAWHTEYLSLYPSDDSGVVDGACDVGDGGPAAFRLRMVGDGWVAEPISSVQRGQDILADKTPRDRLPRRGHRRTRPRGHAANHRRRPARGRTGNGNPPGPGHIRNPNRTSSSTTPARHRRTPATRDANREPHQP